MDEQTQRQLMLLRIQLYGAMQTLKGEALDEFWTLIDEINDSRPLFPDSKLEAEING